MLVHRKLSKKIFSAIMPMKMKLAVIAFPGNNCEIETARWVERAGFSAKIFRWNQSEEIKKFSADGYILPGGFSFEDRGRSGSIAARESIFDVLRDEAQRGKIILGICNGAQMIIESGLIPVGENPIPLVLTKNIRHDQSGEILGIGYYNDWCHISPERKNTAFTSKISGPMRVPIAHAEGRFFTHDKTAEKKLEDGSIVAFRYTDECGRSEASFPTTPNGAMHATAAVVNEAGTIMAMMPHPERFFDRHSSEEILHSMADWIGQKKSPEEVFIGDFSDLSVPKIFPFDIKKADLLLTKKLIINDNACFSVRRSAEKIAKKPITLSRKIAFVITGETDFDLIKNRGFLHHPRKEILSTETGKNAYLVMPQADDESEQISAEISEALGKKIVIKKGILWDFDTTDADTVKKILHQRLLWNPNAEKIWKL